MESTINRDRNKSIEWARSILLRPRDYYILDTETTGLDEPEIIELAVIDLEHEVIINQQFCPIKDVEKGASRIHGLTKAKLSGKPIWKDYGNLIRSIISNRTILIYNAGYDISALDYTATRHDLSPYDLRTDCVMHCYSQFVGEWNDWHWNYRWQKLPGGDHTALGDCIATLSVIKQMAAATIIDEETSI
jgi:DNA polymerase-3 subunit epsilon